MKHRILGIALLLFGLALALYIYNLGFGGLGLRFPNLGKYFISPFGNLKTTTTASRPSFKSSSPVLKPPEENISPAPTSLPAGEAGSANQISPSEIPSGFTIKDLSPYFKKISVYVSPAYSFEYYSQLSLNAYGLNSGEKIDVTNWKVKWVNGEAVLPQGVEVYDPSGWEIPQDIYLGPGGILNVYSSRNPLSYNFRLNKCSGYLSNNYQFVPPLNLSCPIISRAQIYTFSDDCQNYLSSLGSCQPPNPNAVLGDSACQTFMNNLNYRGCFSAHRNDYDFLSNEWRAWISGLSFDYYHDRILLFDRNRLLVSEYQY